MKKIGKVILIIVLLIILFIVYNYFMANKEIKEFKVNNIDILSVNDGSYRGKSKLGPVEVESESTIKDGKILEIKIHKHQNALGSKAEEIVKSVIEEQSLDVETISGATASSKAILKSIENALENK